MCAQVTNTPSILETRRAPRQRRRFGVLGLFGVIVLVYLVIALTSPWATHMGGRSTPFMFWTGTGKLTAKSGTYPIYIVLSPSSHFSRLRLDGLRPTGGVSGTGLLCASPGTIVPLRLSGTIYGGWLSTDGALIEFRVLEANNARQQMFDVNHRGYFDLFGYWHGAQLAMNDRGEWSSKFRSGLRVEQASVTFNWGSKSDFEAACANTKSGAVPSKGAASK